MAKRKIVWSSKAKFDLLKILEYFYIRNGSKTYSVKLNSKIRRAVRLLSNHPFLGLQSDVENVRAFSIRFTIFQPSCPTRGRGPGNKVQTNNNPMINFLITHRCIKVFGILFFTFIFAFFFSAGSF